MSKFQASVVTLLTVFIYFTLAVMFFQDYDVLKNLREIHRLQIMQSVPFGHPEICEVVGYGTVGSPNG